ncbi:glycoside hydrolase family 1 protein [Spiroplasma clarkii]|uniref:glycoside hydrolase family 1 protein n=1 Tax=Spiroplasma clarkii TaxID=2139 RepID=UPI0021502E9E|nr:glycoside hydrolase family 1 protein [Spiroplasma clarkii]
MFEMQYKKKKAEFFEGIGPNITSDFMRNYKTDLKMLSEIKLTSLRTSFSWARLYPDGKNLDNEAVKYYHNYLDECIKNNIIPHMCLFHFDMPAWASELGGWSSEVVIESFIKYADFIFSEYGAKVKYFTTFNEPLNPIVGGFLGDGFEPYVNDPRLAIQQAYGMILAHAKVVEIFREKNYHKDSKIGIVFDWNYTYPFSESENDKYSAKIFDAYINKGPLKILAQGVIDDFLVDSLKKYQMLPKYTKSEIEIIKKVKVDFLGINYYFPKRAAYVECNNPRFEMDNVTQKIPADAIMNVHRGWEIYPQALYDIGLALKNEFQNIPWYIGECGMGVQNEDLYRDKNGMINDDYRIDFLEKHLEQIKRVIDMGSNCFGFHVWAAIDCWSFRNAYKNRYGLIEVNLKNQERRFKKSAYWYKKLIENRS